MGKKAGKIQLKTQVVNTVRNFLITPNNLLQMDLKLLQFEEQQRQLVISLEIKLLIKLQESQKLHQGIIQKKMKKKLLGK